MAEEFRMFAESACFPERKAALARGAKDWELMANAVETIEESRRRLLGKKGAKDAKH